MPMGTDLQPSLFVFVGRRDHNPLCFIAVEQKGAVMRRSRVLLFLVLLAIPLIVLVVFVAARNATPSPHLPASVGEMDAVFAQAVQAAESGDYAAALDTVNQMIAQFPEHAAEGYMLRATIYYVMGEHEQGISAASEAIRVNPTWLPAYYMRGMILLEQHEYDEALADFDYILTVDPDYSDAFYGRASVYMQTGDFREAREAYNTAIELNAENIDYYLGRAWLRWTLINFSGMQEDASRALELDPNNSTAYALLAYAHTARHECELAQDALDQHTALAGNAVDRNLIDYYQRECG